MVHCKHPNCYNEVVAKDLCGTHYKRLQRHGDSSVTRPIDWGQRDKHPLYDSWKWMRKMRVKHVIQPEWENFWEYVKDIGERPSPNHQLRKLDESLGFVRGNLIWKEVLASSQDRLEYAKAWRKANPDKAKNADLKKTFGITLEEYNKLLEIQKHSCAICNKSEEQEKVSFAVDHCHTTGKIRGLLCSNCNRGLGLFGDLIGNLQNAINYLGDKETT